MTTLRIKMTNLFRAGVMPSKDLPDHHSAPHKIGNKSSHKGLTNRIPIACLKFVTQTNARLA
jgi:hypothetical protein